MRFHLIKIIIDHLKLGFAIVRGIHALTKSMGITQALAVPANMFAGGTKANMFAVKLVVIYEVSIHDGLDLIDLRRR